MNQSSSSPVTLALAITAALLAPACERSAEPEIATETGNPYEDPDEGTTANGCDLVKTSISLDAPTDLGFDAQTIVDLVAGQQSQALAWVEAAGISYGPESGTSQLTLSVEPLGIARWIDRAPASSGASGGTQTLAETLDGCRDSIEIDVRLGLETAGGALAESVETTVEAYARDFAEASFGIDLAALTGSFDAQLAAPANTEVTRATLVGQIGFSEYGAVGAMRVQSELRSIDGNSVGQSGGNEVAHFPAETYCGAPNAVSVLADQPVRGLSLAAALAGLNAQSPTPVTFTPAGSSELELVFSADSDRVCVAFDHDAQLIGEAGGAVLRVPGSVRLHSADGRLDGEIAVEIAAQTVGGALELWASAADSSQEPARAAALAAEFGVQDPVDVAGRDGASARLSTQVSETEGAGGSLVISALEVPECISNPAPIEPGAMSVPGCSGIAEVPLWSARWGTP